MTNCIVKSRRDLLLSFKFRRLVSTTLHGLTVSWLCNLQFNAKPYAHSNYLNHVTYDLTSRSWLTSCAPYLSVPSSTPHWSSQLTNYDRLETPPQFKHFKFMNFSEFLQFTVQFHLTLFTMALLPLILLIALDVSYGHPPLVARPNLGVVFSKQDDVSLSPTVWHHTVAVPFFPDLPDRRSSFLCNTSIVEDVSLQDTCSSLQEIHVMYEDLAQRLQMDIAGIHTSIVDVMSLSLSSARGRSRPRRGWINFLGNIAKKVMGVATEADIKVLQAHMAQLMDMMRRNNKDRVHDVTKLHSYEVKMDLRMDKLQKHLVRLDQTLATLSDDINVLQTYAHFAQSLAKQVQINVEHINATYRILQWLNNYSIHIHTLSQLRVSAASQLSAVSQLVEGKLTIDVIQPQHLRDIIENINALLAKQSRSLFINGEIDFYYKTNNLVTVSHDDRYLYVKIRLPVSSPDTEFELYKVATVPIPTSQRNEIYTKLIGISDWFALSKDGQSYLELSHNQAHDISNAVSKVNYLPVPVSNLSCMVNLFNGQSAPILKTCRHQIINKPITPVEFVYSLPPRGYLVFTPSRTWTTRCYNSSIPTTKVTHKSLFSIDVQCGCTVSSYDTELLSDAHNCAVSNTTIKFSANFLVYYKLYKKSHVLPLDINNLTNEPYNFDLPRLIHEKINFTDLEIDEQLASQDQLDLDSFVASQSNDDMAWTFDNWLDNPSSDTMLSVFAIISAALHVIFLIFAVYSFRKYQVLAASISTAAVMHITDAADFTLPTPTSPPSIDDEPEIPVWRTAIIIASFCISLMSMMLVIIDRVTPLLAKIKSRVSLEHLHTELYCSMYSASQHLHIHLMDIPFNIEDITCDKLQDIHDIRVSSRACCAFLHVNWNNFELYMARTKIRLPLKIKVPLWQRNSYTRIASERHTVKITLVQQDKFYVISNWSRMLPHHHVQRPAPVPVTLRYPPSSTILAPSATSPLLPRPSAPAPIPIDVSAAAVPAPRRKHSSHGSDSGQDHATDSSHDSHLPSLHSRSYDS